jgi:Zn-dependent peptidase ImmA (M78 family)/transcriptional regulator with XRE-family HTH domain
MAAPVNPGLLLLARQYRGKSQAEVAQRAGLTQGHYSRVENGLLPNGPSEDTVRRIAEVLRFPPGFFSQSDRIYGLPLSVHPMHRKKADVGERALQQLHAELNIRLMHIRRLLSAIELEPEWKFPTIDVDEGGGPEKIAATLRQTWALPPGPIVNLTDCVERAGVLVIWCRFEANVDGVKFQAPDLPPCIFLNSRAPADRMRFSLAHECGHLVMHTVPTDDIENEAHAFARCLLMPERDIKRHFIDGVTIERLLRLKSYWRVSAQALLFRAREIDCITKNQSDYLWRIISSRGWRTREPADTDFPYETPTLFPRMVEIHTKEFAYSRDELATVLNVLPDDLSYLYSLHGDTERRSHLRIVK